MFCPLTSRALRALSSSTSDCLSLLAPSLPDSLNRPAFMVRSMCWLQRVVVAQVNGRPIQSALMLVGAAAAMNESRSHCARRSIVSSDDSDEERPKAIPEAPDTRAGLRRLLQVARMPPDSPDLGSPMEDEDDECHDSSRERAPENQPRHEQGARSDMEPDQPMSMLLNKRALHNVLGEGVVRKSARPCDGKVLFQWERSERVGRGSKRRMTVFNRWVSPSELKLVPVAQRSSSSDGSSSSSDHQPSRRPAAFDEEHQQQRRRESEEFDSACGTRLPSKAAHHQERKLKEHKSSKKPLCIGGQRRSKTVQHISAARMIENHFPHEQLVPDPVNVDAVFCRACKKKYPLIKSSLTAHILSSKHVAAKDQLVKKMGDDGELKIFLEDYFRAHPMENGASLGVEMHVYRYRVVESMLGNGIALSKINGLRALLERSGVALTDSSNLSAMVPRVLEREKDLLRRELHQQYVTFIFDGTSRLGEAVNVVYRFCPPDFSQVKMLLVDFTTLEKHMSGNQLGRHLIEVISTNMKIPYENVVGSARDSCATNGAGLRVIQPFLPSMVNLLCYSHMLQGTASRFGFSAVDEFVTPFLVLQSMAIVKSLWKQVVGTSMKGFSKIRWWSRWELLKDLAEAFGGKLDSFVCALMDRDIGDETTRKMNAVLANREKRDALQLELAVIMDMEVFVRTTYDLEGDGLCILQVYDRVEALRRFGRSLCNQTSLPNSSAVLRSRVKLEAGVKFRQYWSEQEAPGNSGWYDGQIISKRPGSGQLCAVQYANGDEMFVLKSEEQAFRGNILAHELAEWSKVVDMITPAFDYIEDRLNNNCDAPYHMKAQHLLTRVFKVQSELWQL